MIYARSPYIIYDNTANLEDIGFKLYVYRGTKDTDKGTPDYTFLIDAINGEVQFDISPFIREVLGTVDRSIGPQGTGRYVWVTTEIAKDTGSGLGAYSTYEATQLACDGYTTPDLGVNYTTYLSDPFLFDVEAYSYVGTTNPIKGENSTMHIPVTVNPLYLGVNAWSLNWYTGPGGTGSLISSTDVTATDKDESDDNMQFATIPATARSVIWKDASSTFSSTREIFWMPDCQNTPTRVFFINRYGVKEEIQFFGRAIESYTTNQNEYKRTILSGGTYSVHQRQMAPLNKRSTKSVQVSSGAYPEGYNTAFKQLMLSEKVWILVEGGDATDVADYRAVSVVDSDFTYKYSKYDKKIEYTMTFEYANSELNDIA